MIPSGEMATLQVFHLSVVIAIKSLINANCCLSSCASIKKIPASSISITFCSVLERTFCEAKSNPSSRSLATSGFWSLILARVDL